MIIVLLICSIALASRGGGGGRGFEDGLFWGSDLNRNEQLDREEAKSVFNLGEEAIFNRYDENGDGQINRTEFMEFMQQAPWTKKFNAPEKD